MLQERIVELNKVNKIRVETLFLALYFLLAPFEDMLNFGAGTILKYIAYVIITIIFLRLIKGTVRINFADSIILIPSILIIISWASVLWSLAPSISFARNITYTVLLGLFIITNLLKLNTKEVNLINKAIIISGIGIFFYIILNYNSFLLASYGRFTLTAGNDPNNLAAHLILPLFVSSYYFIKEKRINRLLYLTAIGFILFSILITGSRGALLAAFLGYCYVIMSYLRGKKKYKIIFSSVLIVIAVYFVITNLPHNITERLFGTQAYLRDFESTSSRSSVWKNVILYIIPNMSIFGFGSGVAPYLMVDFYGYIKGIHNTYLNMILEYGILGVPFFMALLRGIYIKTKTIDKVYTGMLISMLVLIFFLDSYPKKFFWNMLIYLSIAYNSRTKRGV